MKFSKAKFQQLSQQRRYNKLLQFIDVIEDNWEHKKRRMELLENLKEFMSFFADPEISAKGELLSPLSDRREFLKVAVPLERQLSRDLRDHQMVIKKLDGEHHQKKNLPLVLVLDNLRSAFNTGSIMRSAECFGVGSLCLCGYTPDNKKVLQTAMGTRKMLTIEHYTSTEKAIEYLQKEGYYIYALETCTGAENLYQANYHFPSAIILGNEALGIAPSILKMCDGMLEIPLNGWKNSLNVASAAAIALSHFNAQYHYNVGTKSERV